MIPYILFILMTLTLSIIYDGREDSRGKRIWYAVTYLFLVLVMGFRNGVGGDTQSYMAAFDYVPAIATEYGDYITENFLLRSYMPGWSLLNILAKRWFDSFYAVQMIEALIVNTCVFYIFNKYTKKIFLCILMYAFTGYIFRFNTEVMREAIAISLISVGMYKYLNGQKIYFYLSILVGLLFHVSALTALLFPLARLRSISYKTLIAAFLGSFALWAVSNPLMLFIMNHLLSDSAIANKILNYSDQASNIFGFLELALQLLVSLAGILYFAQSSPTQKDILKEHYAHYVTYFLILTVIICAIPGTYRILNYAAVFYIILVTEFIGSLKYQMTLLPVSKSLILLIFCFYSVRWYVKVWPESKRHNYEFFVPYTSALDKNANTDYRYYMWECAVNREKTVKNSRTY